MGLTFFLQIFDDDFRQVSSVFVSSNLTKVYVINRLYYCVDHITKQLRVSLVHNGSVSKVNKCNQNQLKLRRFNRH